MREMSPFDDEIARKYFKIEENRNCEFFKND